MPRFALWLLTAWACGPAFGEVSLSTGASARTGTVGERAIPRTVRLSELPLLPPPSAAQVHRHQKFVPKNIQLPGTSVAPLSPARAVRPAAPAVPGPIAPENPPAPKTTFTGLLDNDASIPPDTNGAVGPSHLVVMLNTEVRIQTRAGVELSKVSLNAFWGTAAAFDPHVIYDEDSGHFIAVAMDSASSASSKIMLAVTATADPTGAWNIYTFTADGTGVTWADFPAIGINHKWIAFSAGMFKVAGNTFVNAKMWVFDKAAAVAGGALAPTIFATGFSDTGFGSVPSMQGGLTYDPAQANLYFVDSPWTFSGNSYLRLSQLTGPVGAPVWSLVPNSANPPAIGDGFIQVTNYANPLDASQPGSNNDTANDCTAAAKLNICTGDSRIINAVFRNGFLWTTHAGFPLPGTPSRSSVFWYQINPTVNPPVLVQDGVVDDPVGPHFFYYPSIAVDSLGDVALGFTGSSTAEFPSGYYTIRYSSDALSTMETPFKYKSGAAKYSKSFGPTFENRWGDFSATWPDPANVATFWTIQEYSETSGTCGGGGGVDCWGTQWAQFIIRPSTPPVTSPPADFIALTRGVSSITWTWDLLANATSYHVFYATNTSVFIATVTAPRFDFTGLDANFLTGIFVTGANQTGDGPGTTAPSTSTLALPVTGIPAATAFASSITVAFASCPAAPAASSCSGYVLNASTVATFAGTILSSATGNFGVSQLAISGLSPLTTYYLRLATLNSLNGPNFVSVAATETLTNLVPPGAAPFSGITTGAIQLNWTLNGNPPAQTYSADASTAANFTGAVSNISGIDITSAAFTALSVNTTYFFRVRAIGGAFLSTGPVATLALSPAAAPFSGLGTAVLTASWGAGGDPPGTLYVAQLSPAGDFSAGVLSSRTFNTSAAFGGLSVNTTYFARVEAISQGGTATSFTALGSTSTLASPLAPAAAPFSAQFNTGFTGNFTAGGNPPGTPFAAQISTSVDFSAIAGSSITFNTFATFSGLTANATYYFAAAALNNNGVPSSTAAFFAPAVSTVTLALPPTAAPALASNQTASALRMSWADASNSAATAYTAQLSADPLFGGGIVSSTTANRYADFSVLLPNTTYFLRVKALSLGPPNPDSAFAALGGAATLANAPAPAAPTFISVTYASVTVQWTPLPASPPDASSKTCEGYSLQASTDAGFGGVLFSNAVAGAASSQSGISGLAAATTYYLRVGSLNWNGVANYTAMGSTQTVALNLTTAAVTASGLSLSIVPRTPQFPGVTVNIPPGAFPPGTVITLNTSVDLSLPPPKSNEAQISALGGAFGFSLSAGGLQPLAPVSAVVTYNPALLPLGVAPSNIALARFDDPSGQWTLLPTFADASHNAAVAQLSHFSLFSAFGVSAASDLGGVNIFPIPWEPTSDNSLFNAPSLTISNAPANARVRIFTIAGELAWEGNASSAGVLNWPGNNRFGRNVGSGTYLLVIEGGGRRIIRRAVVVR